MKVELSDEKVHEVIPKNFSHKGRNYRKTYCGQSYCIATISEKEVNCSICAEKDAKWKARYYGRGHLRKLLL